MRITLRFEAQFSEEIAHEALHGWRFDGDPIEWYLPEDMADRGLIGGEFHGRVHEGKPTIEVLFWLPCAPDDDFLRRIKEETCAQITDGLGEAGFIVDTSRDVSVFPRTFDDVAVEVTDDGRVVPPASEVAIAARQGELARLKNALADHPEEVDRRHQGCTALGLAIGKGHVEVVEILLRAGADPNMLNPREPPLMDCVLNRRTKDEDSLRIAKLLVRHGADPFPLPKQRSHLADLAAKRSKNLTAEFLRSC